MRHAPILLAFLASGCSNEITLTGILVGTRDDKSLAWPGAEVRAYDQDGVLYGSTTSNSSGRFRVTVPRGQTVFVEVGDDYHPTASFTGVSGFSTPLHVNLGANPEIYGVKRIEHELLMTQFAGCPGLEDGALVVGQAFANDLLDLETDEHPILATVTAQVVTLDGEIYDGCYLDGEGEQYSADAEATGDSGIFAVAGLPPGLHTLVVENHVPGGITSQTATAVFVDEAVVLPRFPFLMESGLLF
ncbi:MAG: hypothetical protein EP330_29875 [Deltaproteobacteria bacterium]|nr:MAG: hypothetical protein EP330_29875 [Deltaproteobacteria bacterium]